MSSNKKNPKSNSSVRNYSALLTMLFILPVVNSSDYEAYCGEVALSCIENCQVFQHKCSATYLAQVVKDSIPGRTTETKGNNNYIPNSFPASPDSKQQDLCKKQGHVCAVAQEYQKSECCKGQFCIPFHRQNGQRSGIGSCKVLSYDERLDPRITKEF